MRSQVLIPPNLFETLRDEGFLSIDLAPQTAKKIEDAFSIGKQFFQSSLDEKNQNSLPDDFGYRPIGIEYSASPDLPDMAESFSVCARMDSARLSSHLARMLYNVMLDVFDVFEITVEAIATELQKSLNANSDLPQGAFRQWSRLQLNYSRPSEMTTPFINEPHEDGDFLTIACSTGPGLELRSAEGASIPKETALGEVLVIPGEIAWLLSGGLIRPCWHCVRPQAGEIERMALLFFGDLDPRLCQPWVQNEVNAHVNIGERVLKSVGRFGLKGFKVEE